MKSQTTIEDYLNTLPGSYNKIHERMREKYPNISYRTCKNAMLRMKSKGLVESKELSRTVSYKVKVREWHIKKEV